MAVGLKLLADWFVGAWVRKSINLSPGSYPLVHLGIVIGFGLVTIIKSFFYGYTHAQGSVTFFSKLVWSVLRRPLRFFDTTPSGQIYNRCIKDIADIDQKLPTNLEMMLDFGFTFLATFALLSVISPVHLIIVLIFLAVCFKSTSTYVSVSTDLKRIHSLALSPVISTLGEIITGSTTIS